MALKECLDDHDNHVDLLYLTDSEVSVLFIRKWVGGGAKLNLHKSPDADVLKEIILKLQKRVEGSLAHQCLHTSVMMMKEFSSNTWRSRISKHTCEALRDVHTMTHHRTVSVLRPVTGLLSLDSLVPR